MGNYSNIDLDFVFSSYKLSDNSIVSVQIWDTPGQDRFKSIVENSLKKADSIILIYDISNKYSFNKCKNYCLEAIKKLCKDNIKVMLIGNKKDLEYERQISFEEANDFALTNNYIYMETSCLKNENVYEAVEKTIEITVNEKKKEKEKENELQLREKIIKENECNLI